MKLTRNEVKERINEIATALVKNKYNTENDQIYSTVLIALMEYYKGIKTNIK